MKKFEYNYYLAMKGQTFFKRDNLIEILNNMGREGWEMFATVPGLIGGEIIYVFKRELQE